MDSTEENYYIVKPCVRDKRLQENGIIIPAVQSLSLFVISQRLIYCFLYFFASENLSNKKVAISERRLNCEK